MGRHRRDVCTGVNWWLKEISIVYLVAAILIGLINRMPEEQFVRSFIVGCKDMIGVAW
ncbi:hypothetical protein JCM19239_6098 [Vibrio variabilis]|uniref:Uncharacterized protein n=1 Tax=Vibrio variabilis TaxID=990271 RepID=A0ABQ0JJU7_9VIBR|nr:hypothetical protein JCM19239_6098 [Vibrio variabilis]